MLLVRKLYRVVATAPRFCVTFAETKVAKKNPLSGTKITYYRYEIVTTGLGH